MTTCEYGQRAPRHRARRKRRPNYGPVMAVLESTTPTPEATETPTATPAPTEEPVLWRDDIVTDGNLLAYDLQETMQACCEEYGVPYALALAVADAAPMTTASCKSTRSIMGGFWSKALTP